MITKIISFWFHPVENSWKRVCSPPPIRLFNPSFRHFSYINILADHPRTWLVDTIGRIGAYQYREQVGDKEVRKRLYFQENAHTFRCSISRWPKVKAVDEILLSLQNLKALADHNCWPIQKIWYFSALNKTFIFVTTCVIWRCWIKLIVWVRNLLS